MVVSEKHPGARKDKGSSRGVLSVRRGDEPAVLTPQMDTFQRQPAGVAQW